MKKENLSIINNSQPEEHIKIPLFKGLRGTLLLNFLLLAIVPVAVVIIITHQIAYKNFYINAEKALISITIERTREIDTYFKEMLTDLKHQSEMRENMQFLSNLTQALENSNKQVSDFIKSYKWAQIVDELGYDLKQFRRTYNYYDMLLIDNKGNILFSIAQEDDLGTNLFNGIYSKTACASSCRQTLKTGLPVFSDYEIYAPSAGNKVFGFIVSAVLDDDGEKIGAIAFQFPITAIDTIMQAGTNLGSTFETYLIGPDFKMRSNSILSKYKTVLEKQIKTEQSLLWKTHVDQGLNIKKTEHFASIYDGPHGRQVLGIHHEIAIQGISFGVIAEIEAKEAFASIRMLRNIMFALLGATALLVFFAAMVLSRRIVLPVQILTFGAEKVSKGDYDQVIKIKSKNEIGKLVGIFNSMVENLRRAKENNDLQNWYKTGHTQLHEQIQNPEDMAQLCRSSITFMAKYINAHIGALYVADDNNTLRLMGSYAYSKRKNLSSVFKPGQGLVGQAALEKAPVILSRVPDDYIVVKSGLGKAVPVNIAVVPFMKDDRVTGVMEFGSFHEFSDKHLAFLNLVSESIAVSVHTLLTRIKEQQLLEQTRNQEKALIENNRQLEEQTEILKKSEQSLQKKQEELKQKNEELQCQEEELRQTNEELGKQTAELEEQAAELEEQGVLLKTQKNEIEQKNIELGKSKKAVELKARDVEIASKYKSEFLANMSHELRTPLNSILLLSKLLSDNKNDNLTKKQVEYAGTINSSGSELLHLINEILDLSKIESGQMEFRIDNTDIQEIALSMERTFKAIAHEKEVDFSILISPDLPEQIRTDRQRVEQILKNLLSNAFKFTKKGRVSLDIIRPDLKTDLSKSGLAHSSSIAFSVSDTGIGIPKDKQEAIFGAFQQVDGTTSREFGGTGLGLSISRELSLSLGGEIQLENRSAESQSAETRNIKNAETQNTKNAETQNTKNAETQNIKNAETQHTKGSVFTLYLPEVKNDLQDDDDTDKPYSSDRDRIDNKTRPDKTIGIKEIKENKDNETSFVKEKDTAEVLMKEVLMKEVLMKEVPMKEVSMKGEYISDDRKEISSDTKSILIIEDDPKFASILCDISREKGFKVIAAEDGETGLHFADYYQPSGIVLDIGLPKMNGWSVMSRLKENLKTRHIPVHFMSASDKNIDAMKMGAVGYLTKPVTMKSLDHAFEKIDHIISTSVKHLLVVEDNKIQQKALAEFLSDKDVRVTCADNGKDALESLETSEFDCIILDIGLPDMPGVELLSKIRKNETYSSVPVIIYTGKELTNNERKILNQFSESIIIKGAKTSEKLFDEVSLFLHRVEADLPAEKQEMLRMIHDKESILKDKTLLVVDDDMRNVFALTSILEEKGLKVLIAKNGKEAVTSLENNHHTDLVLMDIMMPVMDGYEAIKVIKAQKEFKNLPIIALTAKAMKGDRAKCIEAGASDYLSKPINTDKLFSLLRVWLY